MCGASGCGRGRNGAEALTGAWLAWRAPASARPAALYCGYSGIRRIDRTQTLRLLSGRRPLEFGKRLLDWRYPAHPPRVEPVGFGERLQDGEGRLEVGGAVLFLSTRRAAERPNRKNLTLNIAGIALHEFRIDLSSAFKSGDCLLFPTLPLQNTTNSLVACGEVALPARVAGVGLRQALTDRKAVADRLSARRPDCPGRPARRRPCCSSPTGRAASRRCRGRPWPDAHGSQGCRR